MIQMPESGMHPSVRKHNCDIVTVCDWVEASVLFQEEPVSQTDIIDIFLENNVYSDQDFAKAFVEDVWSELRRRSRVLGRGRGIDVSRSQADSAWSWQDVVPYAFCLFISLRPYFAKWSSRLGGYTKQGNLFEKLTSECMAELGWQVHEAYWSPDSGQNIEEIVLRVGEVTESKARIDGLDDWFSEHTKDGGLDLVCVDPFHDGWGGFPVLLVQCASGQDWPKKCHTPELSIWNKAVEFRTSPLRCLAIPYALSEKAFRRASGRVDGLLLDRFRIASPEYHEEGNWLSQDLMDDISSWMERHISNLPSA